MLISATHEQAVSFRLREENVFFLSRKRGCFRVNEKRSANSYAGVVSFSVDGYYSLFQQGQ